MGAFAALWHNLVNGLATVLAWLYDVIPNYGLAIVALTVLVRLVLFPLTAKQAKSMRRMQQVQPEIKRLQARYKDDRQKLNEELMKFYKENSINPVGGCLPLVFQTPVFFALYEVLERPIGKIPAGSNLFRAFCSGETAKACAKTPHKLTFLGMVMSDIPRDVKGGFGTALPYYILIALIVITGYLQFKQTQANQASSTTSQSAAQAKIMGTVFPVFYAWITYVLPTGVGVYFLVSNAWQIGQQALVFRNPIAPLAGGVVEADGSAPRSSGGDASADDRPSERKGGGGAGPPATGGRPGRAGKGSGGPGGSGGAGRSGGSGGGRPPKAEPAPEPAPESRLRRALGAAREREERRAGGGGGGNGASPDRRPARGDGGKAAGDSRAPGAAGNGRAGNGSSAEGSGRSQPSGTRPRPKKRPPR